MTKRFIALLAVILAAAPLAARAQDLGSTAIASGAMGQMESGAMHGAQQQVNRAAAIANATAAPAPTATQVKAAATVNAVNAMAAPGALAPSKPGAAPAPGPRVAAPPPAEAAVDIHAPFKQSFFFTTEDILNIKKALENQIVAGYSGGTGGGAAQVIPPVRRIALSGIIYKAADDWLIWINGQKVTPHVLLKEIVDIKVEREDVHLKWFDIGANKVLDITMRPNETYDIMTGVLMPGIMQ